jgi:hypothetical protein
MMRRREGTKRLTGRVLEHIPWPHEHYREANFTRINHVWQREFGIDIQEVRPCGVRVRVRVRVRGCACACACGWVCVWVCVCAFSGIAHTHTQRIRKWMTLRSGMTTSDAIDRVSHIFIFIYKFNYW